MDDFSKTLHVTSSLINRIAWGRLVFIAVVILLSLAIWKAPELLVALASSGK